MTQTRRPRTDQRLVALWPEDRDRPRRLLRAAQSASARECLTLVALFSAALSVMEQMPVDQSRALIEDVLAARRLKSASALSTRSGAPGEEVETRDA